MGIRKLLLGGLLLLNVAGTARAALFNLPQIDPSMTEPIFKTLASSFAFRPMEGASDLGLLWGVYLGAGGSATDTSLVSSIFSGLTTSYLPNGDLQLGIGLPKGFTVELGMIPKVGANGTNFSKYAGTLKWTFTRSALMLPITAAIRAGVAKSSLDFVNSINGGDVSVSYANTTLESNLVLSKYVGAVGVGFEPYVGIGVVHEGSSLTGTGAGSLFGSSFPAGTVSVDSSTASLWLQAGLFLKLEVIGLTAEYDKMFDVSSWSGKISIRI